MSTSNVVPPSKLQSKSSVVKKETISNTKSQTRINNLANSSVSNPTSLGDRVSSVASTVASVGGGILKNTGNIVKVVPGFGPAGSVTNLFGKLLENLSGKNNQETVNNTAADPKENVSFPPLNYKYNLPPHTWSLPVRPSTVAGGTFDGKPVQQNFSKDNHPGDFHRLRRGVIWHWDNGNYISSVNEKNEVVSAKTLQEQADGKAAKEKTVANNYGYGFQFLWNPETISSAISRNMDVTPSSADRFRSVVGAFPGQETYQFQIMLDRVNDFAHIKSFTNSTVYQARKTLTPLFNPNTRTTTAVSSLPKEILKYYNGGLGDVTIEMIEKLSLYGTMADLEYLFKALNGDGSGQKDGEWATLLKKKTANIGFLSPSLLAFRFGPNAQQHLSFVGWITNLSINHTYFTEDMIPLRTTVSFSCDAFAGSTVM